MQPDSTTIEHEHPLTGGGRTAVSRRGAIVFREAGPWTATVHLLLKHLEVVGFSGAPAVVGSGFDDRGRETLTYIDGEFVHPGPWSDAAIVVLGRMLKDLHHATDSFQCPANPIWRHWFGRELGGPHRVIGHCDTGPWNVVARDGVPVALIDWEVAGPVDALVELAQCCWLNAQLYDDDIAERVGLPSAAERARQVSLLLDGYELPRNQRARFVDRMIEIAISDAADQVSEARVTPDTSESASLWAIAYRTRSAAWMLRHRAMIERAIT